ncbi:MAG: hypothetical protein QM346_08240 [Chloroflexota bacterium]|nr:hypothetical protein [Chloroflexota bacterium]
MNRDAPFVCTLATARGASVVHDQSYALFHITGEVGEGKAVLRCDKPPKDLKKPGPVAFALSDDDAPIVQYVQAEEGGTLPEQIYAALQTYEGEELRIGSLLDIVPADDEATNDNAHRQRCKRALKRILDNPVMYPNVTYDPQKQTYKFTAGD